MGKQEIPTAGGSPGKGIACLLFKDIGSERIVNDIARAQDSVKPRIGLKRGIRRASKGYNVGGSRFKDGSYNRGSITGNHIIRIDKTHHVTSSGGDAGIAGR